MWREFVSISKGVCTNFFRSIKQHVRLTCSIKFAFKRHVSNQRGMNVFSTHIVNACFKFQSEVEFLARWTLRWMDKLFMNYIKLLEGKSWMYKSNYESLAVTTIVIKSNLRSNCYIDDPIMSPRTCAAI